DRMGFVADELGVDVEKVEELQREISPLRDAFAIVRLARIIRRVRPQILHTHTAKAGAVGRIAALLAGPARPPIVVHTFHGHVLRGYFGRVRTEAFRALERLLARSTTALVAVSPQVRDDLVALGVAPASKFAVIRLGIAHELGVMKRCLFLGYQDGVAPFYAALDALLLPSANEGTPVSAMEALASGRPVVATRVGGVPDVIRDGIDGFLADPGDVEALAD